MCSMVMYQVAQLLRSPRSDMVTLTRTVSMINSIENPVLVSAASGDAVCDATALLRFMRRHVSIKALKALKVQNVAARR